MMHPARDVVIAAALAALVALPGAGIALGGDEPAAEGFVSVFNGKDLTGWKPQGKAEFLVQDGCLVGTQTTGAGGDLMTVKQWDNFELRATYRVVWPANSGFWFRFGKGGGYQYDVLKWKDPVAFSGTLYCPGKMFITRNLDESLESRDGWNEARIWAQGDHIILWLNGRRVGECRDKTCANGRIGIQVHGGDGFKGMKITIKRIELRPLKADEAPPPDAEPKAGPVKAVILVGGHGYDQKTFPKAWGGHDDIHCEIWKGEPYSIFDDVASFKYDAIVMYNLTSGMTDKQKANFLKLLAKGVGLVVWHHALANCQDWPEFEKIAGCKFWLADGVREGKKVSRSGTGWGRFKMHIADAAHPITKGMEDFEIQDESYNKQTFVEGIHVLVSTDDPKSDKPIAWVLKYSNARVFGYQSGHDVKAWANPGHRRLLANGIRWVAGRLGPDAASPAAPAKANDAAPADGAISGPLARLVAAPGASVPRASAAPR